MADRIADPWGERTPYARGDAWPMAGPGRRAAGGRARRARRGNDHRDRLTRPLVREGGELVESDWETAMGRIAERWRALLDGPGGWGRFGFYTTGQLFLEEYYTLAVIGKAGIGGRTWTVIRACARQPRRRR